jgi:hypothetical protein
MQRITIGYENSTPTIWKNTESRWTSRNSQCTITDA